MQLDWNVLYDYMCQPIEEYQYFGLPVQKYKKFKFGFSVRLAVAGWCIVAQNNSMLQAEPSSDVAANLHYNCEAQNRTVKLGRLLLTITTCMFAIDNHDMHVNSKHNIYYVIVYRRWNGT